MLNDTFNPDASAAYAYDERGRLARADYGSGPYKRQDFAYDANGNRTSVEWRALPKGVAAQIFAIGETQR